LKEQSYILRDSGFGVIAPPSHRRTNN